MRWTEKKMSRVFLSDRAPKVAAAAVLSCSLAADAPGVTAVSMTAATLAATEVARRRFGVKGLRTSATRAHDTRTTSQIGSVVGRTR